MELQALKGLGTSLTNGNDIQILFGLGGYCDLNGDDCGPIDLGYAVQFGNSDPVSSFALHGNGILSFGSAIDFFGTPADGNTTFVDSIFNFETPAPASYGLNLVSVGQNNKIDFQSFGAFLQSAKVSLGPNGRINAEWFTCFTPTSATFCPSSQRQFLTLAPSPAGYRAIIRGALNGGADTGTVINGVFTARPANTVFLIPARFSLFAPSVVPEPTSWAMLIAGFGFTGAALRRRRRSIAAA
ncbi:MAG: PEPxxWA-CTERM sorting domain-containing protein [Polymorphobacter sp.]